MTETTSGSVRRLMLVMSTILALLATATAPAAADLTVGPEDDTTAPQITSYTLSPTTVDASTTAQTLTAEFTASDDLAGIDRIFATFKSASGNQMLTLSVSPPDVSLSGTFQAQATVETYRENGTWTLMFLTIDDNVGNSRSYDATTAPGPTSFDVISNGDTIAPEVTALRFASTSVDVSSSTQVLFAELDVTDVGSGVHSLSVSIKSPSGAQHARMFASSINRISGDEWSGTYRAEFKTNNAIPNTSSSWDAGIPKGAEPGDWTINFIQVYDRAFNSRTISGTTADALSNGPVTVVSNPADVTQPTLTSFDFGPTAIDVGTSAATVNLSFVVGDDLSGVKNAFLEFRSPHDSSLNPAQVSRYGGKKYPLSSPTLTSGTLSGSMTFPQYSRSGDWTVNRVCVTDWVNQQTCVSGTALTPLGPTTLSVTDSTTAPADADGDGFADDVDNCPTTANADQADLDGDGIGDVCDDDIDGDGLSNLIEIWLGCDPYDPDSDGDGVWDSIEVLIGTNPLLFDTDEDGEGDGAWLLRVYGGLCGCGLGDDSNGNGVWDLVEYHFFGGLYDPSQDEGGGYGTLLEYLVHLCGCGEDPDVDGVPFIVKKVWGGGGLLEYIRRCGCTPWDDTTGGGGLRVEFTQLLSGGLGDDPDNDGLITVIEILLGCDPHDPDTDNDGLIDGDEVWIHGTDPLDDDSDDDGMLDGREIELGCDPNNPDSDGDGLLDGADPAPLATIGGPCGGTSLALDPVAVGTPISLTVEVGGPGFVTGGVDWSGTIDATASPGPFTSTHSYTAAGVHTVRCFVTDTTGGQHRVDHLVVVYDPDGGFVTGGGWIDSPEGAYVANPTLTGKANFGFVSKYKKGATVPTGSTEFQFKAGDLNFHSESYEWLVIAGSDAKFKGVGTINGAGNYGFMITATDSAINGGGNLDAFRIKIWDKDNGDAVVYDNQMGEGDDSTAATFLGGGSIVIHKK